VQLAKDGQEGLAMARAIQPDVIVLDVMLPVIDGFEVCRALRAESTVPILLLSARGEEVDRVLGLEFGADDYLTKPFAMRELIARVRALLRRSRITTAAVPESSRPSAEQPLIAGALTIDPARRQASLAGTPLNLKPKEFDLLRYFARHPGIVLSRDALLREVWGYDFPIDTRTVDVHIRWLREKLEEDPSRPRWIETLRGVGYRFVPPGD
jgi:DNA-binding response OmpR family regulator